VIRSRSLLPYEEAIGRENPVHLHLANQYQVGALSHFFSEHCLDSIRLSLMCSGDMTLVPIRWDDNRGWIMPIFEVDHTCRDYEALREWSLARDAADPRRYPKNAERLKENGVGERFKMELLPVLFVIVNYSFAQCSP